MHETHASGGRVEAPEEEVKGGRVWSTGCLLIVLLAVVLTVVVLPALLWTLGIAYGQ